MNADATKPVSSQTASSERQGELRERLVDLFRESPLTTSDLLINTSLYMTSGSFAKLLFLDEVYRRILHLPGIVMEFGVWLGASTVAFENLRAIHEPYNAQRRIVGFDTFKGYPADLAFGQEGAHFEQIIRDQTYSAPEDYVEHLTQVLEVQAARNPQGHIAKHSLVAGDVRDTVPTYLANHPETLVSLAYFDLATYAPTAACLEALSPYFMPGSIIVFDELGHDQYPGETVAYRQFLSGRSFTINRSRFLPDRVIVELGRDFV